MTPRASFFIVGAQKGGTTSLHRYLSAHPSIFLPPQKELHFFSNPDFYGKGVEWFEGELPRNGITGDCTPDTCFFPEAVERLHAYNPDALLVMLVRDPVYRALSHYWMEVHRCHEDRPIEAALWRSEDEVASSWWNREVFSYRQRGRYAEQVGKILSLYPKEQLLLVRTKDLAVDPRGTTESVCDFLGLPMSYEDYPFQYHFVRSYPEAPREVIERLEEEFAPWNRRLLRDYGVDCRGRIKAAV